MITVSWKHMKSLISILFVFIFARITFAQQIYLETDPDDVYIMKNDSLVGHTPLFITPALGHVLLTKPGYAEINLNLGNYDGSSVQLKFTGRKPDASFYESRVFGIFIAGAVALGGVTAYFKIKADKRFDDYQVTGNPKLLNDTRRFDLISNISFAALQVNLGFLIYYLLKD
jgi:hypothetical protein